MANGPYLREIKALLLRPMADLSEDQQENLQSSQKKYRKIAAEIAPKKSTESTQAPVEPEK